MHRVGLGDGPISGLVLQFRISRSPPPRSGVAFITEFHTTENREFPIVFQYLFAHLLAERKSIDFVSGINWNFYSMVMLTVVLRK